MRLPRGSVKRVLAKVTYRMHRVLSRMLLGKVAGGLPDGLVRSIPERAWDPALAEHVAESERLSRGHVEHYSGLDELPEWFRKQCSYGDRYLYELTDVVASPHTGVIWTPQGHVLVESVGSVQRLLGWGSVVDIAGSGSMVHTSGPVFVAGNTGYYHFIAEVLPSLCHVLRWKGSIQVLVASEAPEYVRDGVELACAKAGVPLALVESSGTATVGVVRLAAFEPLSGFVPEADVTALSRLRSPSTGGAYAVYVSRARTKRRGIREEGELEDMLRSLGVRVVYAETMPLKEQVELFAGASVVVGMHGAGLVNMLWSKVLQDVVEVFPPGVVNDCYARLSVQLGARYQCVTLRGEDVSHGLRLVSDLMAKIIGVSEDPAGPTPGPVPEGVS